MARKGASDHHWCSAVFWRRHVNDGLLPRTTGVDEATAEILMANAKTLPFALSAVTIILLSRGVTIPVTHHITIIGGLAGVTFFEVWENGILALILGAVFGVMAAAIGELGNRTSYSPGDTHIDPPAFAIWPSTTIVWCSAQCL